MKYLLILVALTALVCFTTIWSEMEGSPEEKQEASMVNSKKTTPFIGASKDLR